MGIAWIISEIMKHLLFSWLRSVWPWMQVKVNIINTWCILVTEAVTVSNMIAISLKKDIQTDRQTDRQTDTQTHTHTHAHWHTHTHTHTDTHTHSRVVYVKTCSSFFAKEKKRKTGDQSEDDNGRNDGQKKQKKTASDVFRFTQLGSIEIGSPWFSYKISQNNFQWGICQTPSQTVYFSGTMSRTGFYDPRRRSTGWTFVWDDYV